MGVLACPSLGGDLIRHFHFLLDANGFGRFFDLRTSKDVLHSKPSIVDLICYATFGAVVMYS